MTDQLLTDISGPLPRRLADQGDGTVAEVVVVAAGGGGGGGEVSGEVDVTDRAGRVVGVVSLDPAALAALESTTVVLDADSLAQLETINVNVGLTDTQLRNTPVPVSGTVVDSTMVALQKAEDAPHVSGDQGIMALAVRNDGGAALAGTNGDYVPVTTDSSGALWVRLSAAVNEDAAAASGFAGMGILAVRRDAEATTVSADGDFAEVQVDSVGRVKVNGKITDASIAVPSDVQSVFRTQSFLTTTALAAAGVFTGAGVDAINFRRITGRVVASHAGVLHIEHSDDNVTWDSVDPLTVAAGVAYGFDTPIFARHVRLRYVNGATAQTSFRLSGYLSAA